MFPVNPKPAAGPAPSSSTRPVFPGRRGGLRTLRLPGGGGTRCRRCGADQQENSRDERDENDYRGGPTIFDRRGPGQPARSYADDYPPRSSRPRTENETEAAPASSQEETPVPDQPQTVLVFKDGHQLEVQNYAVIGDTLYDLTPGRHHKILARRPRSDVHREAERRSRHRFPLAANTT